MKTNFYKATLFAFLTVLVISCSKDDDNEVEKSITSASLILKKSNGDLVAGISVYAYDQDIWQLIGDNTNFANGQSASDANGNAAFSNLEYPTIFNDINNNQHTFRFSAHYSLNGVNKKKVTTITFQKGDQKTQNITLD
jgi:hypothetical protein